MKTLLRPLALCAALLAFGASGASAATNELMHTFDISGLSTNLNFAGAFPTLTHDFGAPGTVILVEFDVNYESFDPSWRSEVGIAIDTDDDDSVDADIDMEAFGAPNSPGTFSASGSVTGNTASSNGLVYLTLFEFFTDPEVDPDATFGPDSFVTVTYAAAVPVVPEPSSVILTGIGLVGAGGLALRRRKAATA